jgi:hypothetical protein
MTGGMSWPPREAEHSMAAACTRGIPLAIMAGIVAEPMVMALAAPLPLTVATPMDPTTAACGSAWADLSASCFAVLTMEFTQPKALKTLRTSRKDPIWVRASWGSREKTPVAISTLM